MGFCFILEQYSPKNFVLWIPFHNKSSIQNNLSWPFVLFSLISISSNSNFHAVMLHQCRVKTGETLTQVILVGKCECSGFSILCQENFFTLADSSSDYSQRTGYDLPSLQQEFRTTPEGARREPDDPLPDRIKVQPPLTINICPELWKIIWDSIWSEILVILVMKTLIYILYINAAAADTQYFSVIVWGAFFSFFSWTKKKWKYFQQHFRVLFVWLDVAPWGAPGGHAGTFSVRASSLWGWSGQPV